ncbi:MAG: TolC family protein [Sulfurimonas sp.]|nr:TolC family protein [Sulfurimonas sp.]
MKNNKLISILFLLNFCINYLSAEVLLFSKAYELALENANEIKASAYLSQADEEKIKQEKASLYPQINFSAYYRKSNYETNPLKTKTEQGLINYTLSLKQSIYNAEIYSRIDSQKSRSKYSKSMLKSEKETLAKNLSNAYLDLLKSKTKIELFESYLSQSKSRFLEITKKYKMNLANKMDLIQREVDYNSAIINLQKEKQLSNISYLKMKQLIGIDEYEIPIIDFNQEILEMIDSMRETIAHNNISQKIKQAQIALEISQNDIKIAKDGHLPKLSFDASYSKYDTDNPNIEAPYDNTRYFMFSLNLPIYSGGQVSSKVESSKLKYKAAQEELDRVEKEVKVELNEALTYFDASIESVFMYRDALKSAHLYVESIEQGYKYGLKSLLDLDDAKVKLNEIKYKYIENIYEIVNSYIGLLVATNNFKNVDILDALVRQEDIL